MAGFQCPYCSMIMPISNDTKSILYPCFSNAYGATSVPGATKYEESCIAVSFYLCPNCREYTIMADGRGANVTDVHAKIRPLSSAKQFPDYIPMTIRQDYEEAYSILDLSPKASATL